MRMEPSMVLFGMEALQSILLEKHERIKFMLVILFAYCLEESAPIGYYIEPR